MSVEMCAMGAQARALQAPAQQTIVDEGHPHQVFLEEEGSCWSKSFPSCRPASQQGFELSACSAGCTCGWLCLPVHLAVGCGKGLCCGLSQHPFPEWSCSYYVGLQVMKSLASHVPRNNLYAVQVLTDAPMPTPILPPGLAVREVCEGNVRGEWTEPTKLQTAKTLVYFHGGAFVLCRARTERMIVGNLVKALGGCRAFNVDYPKPPLAPYPAALDNALEVWEWLLAQDVRPKDVVLAGDSAGGNLALALLLRLQATGAEMPAGAVLLSPWVEMLPFSSKSWKENHKYDYIGQEAMMEQFVSMYTAGADHQSPFVAPLFASPEQLQKLPPLWISVGGTEMLRSSIEGFAFRAIQANSDVHLYVGPGMPHVYQLCFWAYRPPSAEQLPRCCWACQTLCPDQCTSETAAPVWESMEQARRFVWSRKVWG
ncbi:unnamed protein product [Effrenium voratum]|uniref:Alpha/beta hydrolase fold-3 domain-containing protein n=1 Tax=Effrenium voratum TaxID=2562239 RepID=A0AA36IG87_9DINO|nr:unnamed protein product [Effrenium voratum]CAJ1426015.1 unnamed protein product [Effrenium voratum]